MTHASDEAARTEPQRSADDEDENDMMPCLLPWFGVIVNHHLLGIAALGPTACVNKLIVRSNPEDEIFLRSDLQSDS